MLIDITADGDGEEAICKSYTQQYPAAHAYAVYTEFQSFWRHTGYSTQVETWYVQIRQLYAGSILGILYAGPGNPVYLAFTFGDIGIPLYSF